MIVLTLSGVLSVMLLFLIENGIWGGVSFYGAILFTPIFMLVFSFICKINYLKILDFIAPCICAMLAVFKVRCLVGGCCGGIELYENADGESVYFPSQIVECVVSLLIMVMLIILDKKKFRGYHYPIYMITYGVLRFGLNFLRLEKTVFVWIISAGHFWSIISIIVGIVSILVIRYYRKKHGIMNVIE